MSNSCRKLTGSIDGFCSFCFGNSDNIEKSFFIPKRNRRLRKLLKDYYGKAISLLFNFRNFRTCTRKVTFSMKLENYHDLTFLVLMIYQYIQLHHVRLLMWSDFSVVNAFILINQICWISFWKVALHSLQSKFVINSTFSSVQINADIHVNVPIFGASNYHKMSKRILSNHNQQWFEKYAQ